MTRFHLRTVKVGAVSQLTRGGFIQPVKEADLRPYTSMA
jgi:hypothetical protein